MILLDQLICSGNWAGGGNVSPDFSVSANGAAKKVNRGDKKKHIASSSTGTTESPRSADKSRSRSDNTVVFAPRKNSPFLMGCWDHSEVD
jgi:hypothetical protein